jgi:hypothetical protein
MSVNIFGSSGQFSHGGSNNRYVDQKFTTLSTNLVSKVNKSGDTISGDLKILINNGPLRTFGVSDIGTGKSMSLLLGNLDNQIRHNFGHPLKIAAANGTKFTCPAGDTCQMGVQNDARAIFFKDIMMNENSITGLCNPVNDKGAATKQYVDMRCVKNSVGYVPHLISNNRSKTGFIVSASSEFTDACNVFNSREFSEWLSHVNENFWIQLECPERVRIHKFALRSARNCTIQNWKLQASNDGDTWDDIFINGEDIDQSHSFYETDSLNKYSTYRILITSADSDYPGLSYWQLYTVDTLV